MSDDTRDLAQRIRDALAFQDHEMFPDDVTTPTDRMLWREGQHDEMIALLRDALARLEADAATIAALEKRVAELTMKSHELLIPGRGRRPR